MPYASSVRHVFGRAIVYRFTALAGDEEVNADSLVSARLYASRPTEAQRQDAAGLLGGFVGSPVISWTSAGDYEFTITFPAFADPNSSSFEEYETYYVVVNFKLESGGPTLASDEAIFIWRVNALTSRIRVEPSDIYARETKIEKLTPGDAWVQPKIDAAIQFVFQRLKSKKLDKRRMFNLEELNHAVTIRALAYCCYDLAGQDNPFWMEKARSYFEEFEVVFRQTIIGYDVEGDNVPTAAESADFQSVRVAR